MTWWIIMMTPETMHNPPTKSMMSKSDVTSNSIPRLWENNVKNNPRQAMNKPIVRYNMLTRPVFTGSTLLSGASTTILNYYLIL